MTDTVDACPECDGTSGLFSRTSGFGCRECGGRFDEHKTRPARSSTDTRKGLTAELAELNPDEVSAE